MKSISKLAKDMRLYEPAWTGLFISRAICIARAEGADSLERAANVMAVMLSWGAPVYAVTAGIIHAAGAAGAGDIAEVESAFDSQTASCLMAFPLDVAGEQKLDIYYDYASKSAVDQKMILMAEVTADLRALEIRYQEEGEAFLGEEEKISADRYYGALVNAFDDVMDQEAWREDYWIMQNLYKEIFVRYYLSGDGRTIYQLSSEGGYAFEKETNKFFEIESGRPDAPDRRMITQEEAENLEDEWCADRSISEMQ